MSDFLSNLLARSFADAPAIQPRLTSRFEAGAVEPLVESQLISEPFTENKVSGLMDEVVPPTVFSLPSQKNSETNLAPTPISEPSKSKIDSETNAIESVAPQAPLVESEKQFPTKATRLAAPAPETKHFSDTNRSASRRTRSAQFEPPSTSGVPTINVTIGRVEVRAIQSPAPASKPNRPAPPKLSLDNYLQKQGGAR